MPSLRKQNTHLPCPHAQINGQSSSPVQGQPRVIYQLRFRIVPMRLSAVQAPLYFSPATALLINSGLVHLPDAGFLTTGTVSEKWDVARRMRMNNMQAAETSGHDGTHTARPVRDALRAGKSHAEWVGAGKSHAEWVEARRTPHRCCGEIWVGVRASDGVDAHASAARPSRRVWAATWSIRCRRY